MQFSVFTDGGSRGNPGPSGFGVVVVDSNKNIIAKLKKYLGTKTNNEAEYLALVEALRWLNENISNYPIDSVTFYADSQLMVRQMQGIYKVKSGNIAPLFSEAQKLLSALHLSYQFIDIPREKNSLADSLANEAMDKRQ